MSHSAIHCRRRCRRGAAIVEMAIVAPLLFTLILGIIEYSRLMMVQQVLINAAREGCRTAVISGNTESTVFQTIDGYLVVNGISGATVTVTPTPLADTQVGDPITVAIQVPYADVAWINILPNLIGKILFAESTMRREANN